MYFFFAALDCICDSQIFTRMVLQFYICIYLHYNFVAQTWHNDTNNRVSSKNNKLIMWIEKLVENRINEEKKIFFMFMLEIFSKIKYKNRENLEKNRKINNGEKK